MPGDIPSEHVEPPCICDEHQAFQYLGLGKNDGAGLIMTTHPPDVTDEPLELTLLEDVCFNYAATLRNHASPWQAGFCTATGYENCTGCMKLQLESAP